MRIITFVAVIAFLQTQQATGDDLKTRDQTVEEESAVMETQSVPAREQARDYSAYLGKTLAELGLTEELAVERQKPRDRPSARPTESAIQSAVRTLVLDTFPISSTIWETKEGRYVDGTLKDGRGLKILFIDGSAVEVMIRMNRQTDVVFHLKKRGL